jgi:hypothetical protein
MNIRETIEYNLKEAVEKNALNEVKYWCKSYKNYLSALNICFTKKTCSKCGMVLPDSAFNKDSKSYKAIHDRCKTCYRKYAKEYYTTKKGKMMKARKYARSRAYGFNLLYPVPRDWHGNIEYVYHHINDNDVVALPVEIHNKYLGSHYPEKKHREALQPLIDKIYKGKKRVSS